MKDTVTIALPKGRLLNPSMDLFRKNGLLPRGLQANSRKLLFENPKHRIRMMIVRAVDVPTYVEYGAADMGIVGKDVLLEQEPDVYEPLDLRFGACRIIVAGPKTAAVTPTGSAAKLKIATKYPRITERYFNEKGLSVEIIRLSGAIELAPLVGLAEQIVDLITTGTTLRENHLEEQAVIAQSTARLIVNRASLKTKAKTIMDLIRQLQETVGETTE
ncbi:MAG: ATP phosphoribosyltransferase [Nitrospirota bacterium]